MFLKKLKYTHQVIRLSHNFFNKIGTLNNELIASLGGSKSNLIMKLFICIKSLLMKMTYIKNILLCTKDDITVIIAIKDRCDERVLNALKSLRNQDYPKELIKAILVDYDSNKNLIPEYKRMCRQYDVRYIRVENRFSWSRGRALNIGIKEARTKYILTSDCDIIFSKNYISLAIERHRENPLQIIISFMLDIPKDIKVDEDLENLRLLATARFSKLPHESIAMTLRYFYNIIGGYDETYEIWGLEDRDIIKRFTFLGLFISPIGDRAFYLHQWHPKFENVKAFKDLKHHIKKFSAYYKANNSILRNKDGWGKAK